MDLYLKEQRPSAYYSKFYNGLRPIIFFCNHLERAKRIWNSRRLLERALALLERHIAVTRVCVCDGNAMNVRWACDESPLGPPESYARMGRGGDAERLKSLTREETFVSEAISDDCAAKVVQIFE